MYRNAVAEAIKEIQRDKSIGPWCISCNGHALHTMVLWTSTKCQVENRKIVQPGKVYQVHVNFSTPYPTAKQENEVINDTLKFLSRLDVKPKFILHDGYSFMALIDDNKSIKEFLVLPFQHFIIRLIELFRVEKLIRYNHQKNRLDAFWICDAFDTALKQNDNLLKRITHNESISVERVAKSSKRGKFYAENFTFTLAEMHKESLRKIINDVKSILHESATCEETEMVVETALSGNKKADGIPADINGMVQTLTDLWTICHSWQNSNLNDFPPGLEQQKNEKRIQNCCEVNDFTILFTILFTYTFKSVITGDEENQRFVEKRPS